MERQQSKVIEFEIKIIILIIKNNDRVDIIFQSKEYTFLMETMRNPEAMD